VISISQQTDYAARIILYLAMSEPGARVTTQEIAREKLIPNALIRRIVTRLGSVGLLKTTKGRGGGIALGRPASEISMLDVVEAMEGPMVLNQCTEDPAFCPFTIHCAIHTAWQETRQMLEERLREYTFDKLAEQEKEALESIESLIAVAA